MSDRKFRKQFEGMNIAGIGSKQLKKLNKEYGEGNWNLKGGKGYAASGTVKQYGRVWGGYRDATVYHKLPKIQQQPAEVAAAPPAPVEEPQTEFTPTPLPTDFDSPPPPPPQQQPQGPDFAALFAEQISSMQQMFQQSMQQQQQQYMQMQQAQDERMAALQQQMQQSMIAQQARPEVAGVQMAEGTGGTPMQIARRGVSGAFGRRGMRISSINV